MESLYGLYGNAKIPIFEGNDNEIIDANGYWGNVWSDVKKPKWRPQKAKKIPLF